MKYTFLAVYQNFTMENPTITLSVILWAMYAGLVLACIMSVYTKNYPGAMVRALIKNGCFDPESAKTLEELGIKASPMRSHTLRDKSTLRKYVKIVNADECRMAKARSSAGRTFRRILSLDTSDIVNYDLSAARFYIPEDKKHVADMRYGSKGTTLSGIIIIIAALILGAVLVLALMYFIPEILELVDEAVTYIKSFWAE